MKFNVAAPFSVEFVDLDADERGIRTVRERVEGSVDCADEEEARSLVREAVEARYPVRWKLRLGPVRVEAAG